MSGLLRAGREGAVGEWLARGGFVRTVRSLVAGLVVLCGCRFGCEIRCRFCRLGLSTGSILSFAISCFCSLVSVLFLTLELRQSALLSTGLGREDWVGSSLVGENWSLSIG